MKESFARIAVIFDRKKTATTKTDGAVEIRLQGGTMPRNLTALSVCGWLTCAAHLMMCRRRSAACNLTRCAVR